MGENHCRDVNSYPLWSPVGAGDSRGPFRELMCVPEVGGRAGRGVAHSWLRKPQRPREQVGRG